MKSLLRVILFLVGMSAFAHALIETDLRIHSLFYNFAGKTAMDSLFWLYPIMGIIAVIVLYDNDISALTLRRSLIFLIAFCSTTILAAVDLLETYFSKIMVHGILLNIIVVLMVWVMMWLNIVCGLTLVFGALLKRKRVEQVA